ncbi:MAG: DUF3604 domain-containing protein [Halieaceae bacterium]|nr:DUF3604 domain-containing protein [Halieaceae bacterium]
MGSLSKLHRYALFLLVGLSGELVCAEPPCDDYNPNNNLYWGDLHVHTRYSLDASTQDTRTTPAQAYAFARGAPLGIQPWVDGVAQRTLQLDRPLDFAAVTDHAELLGEVALCSDPDSFAYGSLYCRTFRDAPRLAFFLFNTSAARGDRLGLCGDDGERCRRAARTPWQDIRAAAEAANDPVGCQFTSFAAYEWTGAGGPLLANLHRNVIFRNAEVPEDLETFVDGDGTVDSLFRALERDCVDSDSGCDALVIPHNSNLSDGLMFPAPTVGELDAGQAQRRRRFENLVEIYQHKGASECAFVPGTSEDELCAFEQLPYNTFSAKFMPLVGGPADADDGFARKVLRDGLTYNDKLGANPFEMGFIGSTDTHLGAAGAVSEIDYAGHGGAGAPAAKERPDGLVDDLEFGPGGLAAVWAPQNRRDDLFDALRRREVYATSGPRITLRVFAGERLEASLCEAADFAAGGYQQGVPMGSVLPDSLAVRIAVAASADPGTMRDPGLDLQRLQIIKGWIDEKGESHEQVYEIAGDPDNGASVDLASCRTSGAGFAQLCAVWEDPDFSSTTHAYYYARAVENPRCRWSQQICIANGVDCSNPSTIGEGLEDCCSESHRPVIQERAVSSPVWHYPGSSTP